MGYTPEVPQDLVAPACGSPASAQGNETRQSPGRELQSCGPGASQLGEHCAGTWDLVPQCGPRILCRQAPSRASGNTWEKSVGCGECSGVLSRFPRWTEGLPSLGTLLALSPLRHHGGCGLYGRRDGWESRLLPGQPHDMHIWKPGPLPLLRPTQKGHFGWSTPWSR